MEGGEKVLPTLRHVSREAKDKKSGVRKTSVRRKKEADQSDWGGERQGKEWGGEKKFGA